MSFDKPAFLTPEAFHELDETHAVLLPLLRRCWEVDFSQRPNARECTDILNSILGADPEGKQAQVSATGYLAESRDDTLTLRDHHQAWIGTGEQQTRYPTSPSKQLGIPGRRSEEEVIRVSVLARVFSFRKLTLSKTLETEADTLRRDPNHPHVLKFVGKYRRADLLFINPFAQNGTFFESVNDRQGANHIKLVSSRALGEPGLTTRTNSTTPFSSVTSWTPNPSKCCLGPEIIGRNGRKSCH